MDPFVIVPVVIAVGFVLVFLIVAVTAVTKRAHTHRGSGDAPTTTRHYITFEREDGTRMELLLGGRQFGMVAEGDRGVLTYQGTRFKDFQRLPRI